MTLSAARHAIEFLQAVANRLFKLPERVNKAARPN